MRIPLRVAAVLAAACVSISILPACTGLSSAVIAALPFIVEGLSDAMVLLDRVDSFVQLYFLKHPNTADQVKVTESLDKVRSALLVAERSVQGAKDLNDKNVQAALRDFSEAWTELMTLVGPLGVEQLPAGAPLPKAAPGKLHVPRPAILKFQAVAK